MELWLYKYYSLFLQRSLLEISTRASDGWWGRSLQILRLYWCIRDVAVEVARLSSVFANTLKEINWRILELSLGRHVNRLLYHVNITCHGCTKACSVHMFTAWKTRVTYLIGWPPAGTLDTNQWNFDVVRRSDINIVGKVITSHSRCSFATSRIFVTKEIDKNGPWLYPREPRKYLLNFEIRCRIWER